MVLIPYQKKKHQNGGFHAPQKYQVNHTEAT